MISPGDRVTKALYVRAQQWRLMTEGTERWSEFMGAVREYYAANPEDRARVDGSDMGDKTCDRKRATFLEREGEARTQESMRVSSSVVAATVQSVEGWSGEQAA